MPNQTFLKPEVRCVFLTRKPEFIQMLTSNQSRLYAYILSLVFDPDQADDVLQQTNSVLWQNEAKFEIGTNFIAWSFRIAYFQVMAHRKRRQRDRLDIDDDLLTEIALAVRPGDEMEATTFPVDLTS